MDTKEYYQLLNDTNSLKDLFSNPKKWGKGSFAKNASNTPRKVSDPDAVCWCLMGGIAKVCDVDPYEITVINRSYLLAFSLSETLGSFNVKSIMAWNDLQTDVGRVQKLIADTLHRLYNNKPKKHYEEDDDDL